MAEEEVHTQSSVHSYHCICSTLILATPYTLENLPTRQPPATDNAIILPMVQQNPGRESMSPTYAASALQNITADRKPLVVRREDGFETRNLLRCARCKLTVAYQLEKSGLDTENLPLYILPGGLMSTEDMKSGVTPQRPVWPEETT